MQSEMLQRLKMDPGRRTLGELLQERQWAVQEIERLWAAAVLPPTVCRFVAATAAPASPVKKATSVQAPAAVLMPQQLLRLPEVKTMIGLSRSTIYQMVATGRFPAPVRVGRRACGWRMAEVVAWLERLGE